METKNVPDLPSNAVISASTAFVIWVASRLYETYELRRKRREDTDRCIVGIFAEIDANTRDMEEFLNGPDTWRKVLERVRNDADFVPHVTDIRHTSVYLQNLPGVSGLSPSHVGRIVYFYGLLDTLKNEVDGIYLPSFKNLSVVGKESTVENIADLARQCSELGRGLMATLQEANPRLPLSRNRHERKQANQDLQIQEA